MIAPLRRWHRHAFGVLAIAVPAILVAAIAARPDAPVNAALPSDVPPSQLRVSRPLAWSRLDVVSSLEITNAGASEIALEAQSLATEPTVLVYWLDPNDASDPPAPGRLLGAVRGTGRQRIPLPADAATRGGRLALYSLAHDEVIATAAIAATGGQP